MAYGFADPDGRTADYLAARRRGECRVKPEEVAPVAAFDYVGFTSCRKRFITGAIAVALACGGGRRRTRSDMPRRIHNVGCPREMVTIEWILTLAPDLHDVLVDAEWNVALRVWVRRGGGPAAAGRGRRAPVESLPGPCSTDEVLGQGALERSARRSGAAERAQARVPHPIGPIATYRSVSAVVDRVPVE